MPKGGETMNMKKTCSLMIALVLMCSVFISMKSSNYASAEIYYEPGTVEYTSKVLDDYLKEKGLNIKKGTCEYVAYLNDLLMFEEDEELKKLPEYEDIKVYAANYVVEIDSLPVIPSEDEDVTVVKKARSKSAEIPESMRNKTIKQLVEESQKEDEEAEKEIENSIKKTNVQTMSTYSPSAAVSYAKKYGETHNKAYNYFKGRNCTNFVSQAVKAGGKNMTVPSNISEQPLKYTTTSYWYNKLVDEGAGIAYRKPRKYSTAWTTVADFYTYWGKKGATRTTYSSKASLQNNLRKGDIVQLYNGSKWHHSIIITEKINGKWYYAANSRDTKKTALSTISNATKYRIIRIK